MMLTRPGTMSRAVAHAEEPMPERPTEVHVGGLRYPIRYETSDLAGDTVGYVSYIYHRITIDSGSSDYLNRRTLIHEICHAIDRTIGQSSRVTEEENTARADALFALLIDARNAPALEWIAHGPAADDDAERDKGN